jgi:hypothetical protein
MIAIAGACSSGTSSGQNGGQGGPTGGTAAIGGGSGPGGSGGAGTGGGTGTATGAGGITDSCLGLRVDSAPQVLYTPPTDGWWDFAGSDDQGILLAVGANNSVRIVSVTPTGSSQVLLDETTYQPTWDSDPNHVMALRRSDGVDLLVSDKSSVALVRKQGSTVRAVQLASTDLRDLFAMGLTAGSSGTVVMFTRGEDVVGDPVAVTAVDVDPLLAIENPYPSIEKQIAQMSQAKRSFAPGAGAVAVFTPTQIWMTTERLDPTTDCKDTGETYACYQGNPPVPWLDCTWHVDAFRLTKAADLQAAPVATIDGRAYLHADCGDTTPVDPHNIPNNLGLGGGTNDGISNHHVAAVDSATARLGLILNYQPAQTARGIQFALVDAAGHLAINGVTQVFDSPNISTTNSFSWLGARNAHLFYCAGDLPAHCWVADSSAISTFDVDTDAPYGSVRLPDGFGVIERMDNPDTSAWLQPLACVH